MTPSQLVDEFRKVEAIYLDRSKPACDLVNFILHMLSQNAPEEVTRDPVQFMALIAHVGCHVGLEMGRWMGENGIPLETEHLQWSHLLKNLSEGWRVESGPEDDRDR